MPKRTLHLRRLTTQRDCTRKPRKNLGEPNASPRRKSCSLGNRQSLALPGQAHVGRQGWRAQILPDVSTKSLKRENNISRTICFLAGIVLTSSALFTALRPSSIIGHAALTVVPTLPSPSLTAL